MEIFNMVVTDHFVPREELQEFQGDLKDQNNAKEITDLAASIRKNGFTFPIMLWHEHDNLILDGHQRLKALNELNLLEFNLKDDLVPVIYIKAETLDEALKIVLMANSSYSVITETGFANFKAMADGTLDLEHIRGLNIQKIDTSSLDEVETEPQEHNSLQEMFIAPPFSVLDTKQGYWQERKRQWNSLGIKSELGREAECLPTSFDEKKYGVKARTGTSIFDPVLTEICYKWFSPIGGQILDPFAGGSVRGIVAAKLGYDYHGNDLREEQVLANAENAMEVLKEKDKKPVWTAGDSLNINSLAAGVEADLIFSCPPYADLEVYSDKKEDISNMPYDEFLKVYREIIKNTCKMLKEDRFAVFVVGDVRDKNGFYQNFVSDTIAAFQDAGTKLYNEMILVNTVGTLAIRAGRQFNIGRKAGKQHQNVLVFYKGNPKNIKKNFANIDFSEIEMEEFNN